MGRGFREKVPSIRLRDYVTNTVVTQSPSILSPRSPAPSASSGTPFPITHYINCAKFSVSHRQFLAAVTAGCEPKSFKEAMTDVGWRHAMQTEIRALEDNGTWTMETLPPGKRALGSQWVYKSSITLMAVLNGLKLVWLFLVIIKLPGSIITRLLRLLQRWSRFVLS